MLTGPIKEGITNKNAGKKRKGEKERTKKGSLRD